ncbi:MAG: DUF3039 domain-containing protein [Acidobacteria bacterium]|nr:DUF3039 domain-containing protein [Acidobacteriota bacterium]
MVVSDQPDILDAPVTEVTEPGDHERFAHYVPKAKLTEAMVNGTAVLALCGKVWVPSRDPGRFPICPECKSIREDMAKREGAGSN